MHVVVFMLLCLIWGSSWAGIKFSLQGIPPFLGAGLRFSAAAVLLFLFSRIRGISVGLPQDLMIKVLITGLLYFTVDYGLIYWAEQYLTAGVTAIFFATFPIFTAILSDFFLKHEPPTSRTYLGLVLGFGGVVLTFLQQLVVTQFNTLTYWASAAVVTSAVSAAVGIIIVKRYLSTVHPLTLSLHQMSWAVFTLVAMGLLSGETHRVDFRPSNLAAVLYLAVFASALAFSLYYWLLQRVRAVTASLIIYITPVIALAIDWILMGETISVLTLGGMGLIFVGVALSQS